MKTLPNKASDLLELAMKDMKMIEKNPLYIIDMGSWHSPEFQSFEFDCAVCLAGCVMANTLKVNPELPREPEDFNNDIKHKLYAIDDLRQGHVIDALESLGQDIKKLNFKHRKTFYDLANKQRFFYNEKTSCNAREYPYKFPFVYKKMIRILRERGL